MKKYLLGIVAVIAAIGFSAFSPEAHKAKAGLTTYFAIKTGTTTWRWDTTIPEGYTCRTETNAPTCSVDAVSQPGDNTSPGGVSNEFYKP